MGGHDAMRGEGRLVSATRILVVDNVDSFVYTIAGYLQQLGAVTNVVRHKVPRAPVRRFRCSGFALVIKG